MVIALVLAVLLVAPLAVPAQDEDPDAERRRLEEILHAGRRAEAAAEAARLVADPGASPAMRRVGSFIRCRILHNHFLVSRSDSRLAEQTARRAERAWLGFLASAGDTPLDLKARFLLGGFCQDRARWRLELNDALYAAEIDRDLTASSRRLREVIQAVPADTPNAELAAVRRWARAQLCVNFHFFARLYSRDDERHRVHLLLALDSLEKVAEAYPGLPAGNRAYFFYGLTWLLYGAGPEAREAQEKAREIFVDLWKAVPWNPQQAPFLDEVLWNICRLDVEHGHPGRVVAAATLLRQRYGALARIPSRHAVMVLAEAALARLATEGARSAADAFESHARWLERRECTVARFRLPEYAVRLADAVRPHIQAGTHPRLMLMAARGLLARADAWGALAWTAPVIRAGGLEPGLRSGGLAVASRAWEARDFLREALTAHGLAASGGTPTDPQESVAHLLRTAALWRRVALQSGLPADRERYELASAKVPRPAGQTEYEAGMRAYANGALNEALSWLRKVEAPSRFHPIALAMRAHLRYLTLPPSAASRPELEKILRLLKALDPISPRAPNWLPAQALRLLTQAMVRRGLGDLAGAAADLADYENQFAAQPQLVPEALKLRVAIELERGREDEAGTTLTTLRRRFPGRRALGEACLILGRHLRSGGGSDPTRLPRSVDLRREAKRILRKAFSDRERYLLAIDEMATGHPARALELLDDLARRSPPALRSSRDALALRRVRCLMAIDRPETAEPLLREVLARKPDHLEPLRLLALLLGGTLVREDGRLVERRHLGRLREAFVIWERIKEHAERSTPYSELWYQVQFQIALLNLWAGNPEQVRARYRWIAVSGYPVFEGHAFAEQFRWLADRAPPR